MTSLKYMIVADQLLSTLVSNDYGEPSQIVWNDKKSTALTKCSTFFTLLMCHTFNWIKNEPMRKYLGKPFPNSREYHDYIISSKNLMFNQFYNVNNIKNGIGIGDN